MDEHERIGIERQVGALVDAIDAERFRHVAGIEPKPSLTPLFEGASNAAHKETVARLRGAGEPALADRIAALRAERAQAAAEERWRAEEGAASGLGPEGKVGLVDAELELAQERSPERRGALGRAAAEACEAAGRNRESAVEERARARAEVGLSPDWEAVIEGDALLSASDDAWFDVLRWRARRELGILPAPQGNLARADLVHLLSLRRWSGLFRTGMLPLALRSTFEALKLDSGSIRVDAEARPAKWPGAHVFGARVSFRPRGGVPDWLDVFEAAGRALAAASSPPHRRDAVFGRALGWLLSSLLLEPRFLVERCDVDKREVADLVMALQLRRLFVLRARAAALRIASEVERGLSGAAWRERYREAMTAALSATWDGVRAARDADAPDHGSALAGAGRGEALRAGLVERFDADWWRNPKTAEHFGALVEAGRPPADEAATHSLAVRAIVEALGR